MTDVESSWKRIERWLEAGAPEAASELLPPTTLAAIAKAEATLGMTLPDDYRASLLCHAGEEQDSYGVMGHMLWPLTKVISTRAMMLKFKADGVWPPEIDGNARPGPGVRKSWFHEAWLPIAANGSRDMVCLDLAPAEGGTVGQLIQYFGDMKDRNVIAPSVGDWLAQRADDMASGRVIAKRDESTGDLIGLRHIDDPDDDK